MVETESAAISFTDNQLLQMIVPCNYKDIKFLISYNEPIGPNTRLEDKRQTCYTLRMPLAKTRERKCRHKKNLYFEEVVKIGKK
ncbi:CGH_3_HP_G0030990.mRNA.1.CDS.1 [Saccharomyces cerevisiae]|nr:CGH_3_HP_G0030990.mRNA.1.CDS.1 [Saccharomyces cerevisiae]CAI6467254.1 CGH_3_HP_G0030990.mRNA.1.CDS.1 [Saccharomyces cerevisiae]